MKEEELLGSFVDDLTNHAFLHSVDLEHDLEDLWVGSGDYRILPAFLHEIAHHSTMATGVGAALAMLTVRATEPEQVITRGLARTVADAARVFAFRAFMRPWIEGVACWAQYDARPAHAHTLSSENRAVFETFVRARALEEELPLDVGTVSSILSQFLSNFRFSEGAVRDKADLLVSPLKITKGGGYFVGYLCVRAFSNQCRGLSDLANDSDFLLAYVQQFLFNDFGLIEALLAESDEPEAAIEGVSKAIQARMRFMFSEEFQAVGAADMVEFDQSAEEFVFDPDRSEISVRVALYDRDKPRAGQALMDTELERLLGYSEETIAIFRGRAFFVVGQVDGEITSDKEGRVSFEMANTTVKGLSRGKRLDHVAGRGRLTLALSPIGGFKVMSVTQDGEVVALLTDRDLGDTLVERDLWLTPFDRGTVLAHTYGRDIFVRELLSLPEASKIVPRTARELVDLEDNYLLVALMRLEENFRKLAGEMRDVGIWKIAGANRHAVMLLVLISLGQSHGHEQWVWRQAKALGIPEDTLQGLIDLTLRTEIPLIGLEQGRLATFV